MAEKLYIGKLWDISRIGILEGHMRIAQLITEIEPAGAERIVCELAKGLKNRGHEILVVTLSGPPRRTDIVEELRGAGIPVSHLGMTTFSPWRIVALRSLLRAFRPDVVHAHLLHANIASRIALLGMRATKGDVTDLGSMGQEAHQIPGAPEQNVSQMEHPPCASWECRRPIRASSEDMAPTEHRTPNTECSHTTTDVKLNIFEYSKKPTQPHLIQGGPPARPIGSLALKGRETNWVTGKLRLVLINTIHIAERRPGKWWHFFLDRVTFRWCDVQIVVSKAARDFHAAKIDVKADLMPVVYNGIETAAPLSADEARSLRREWGVADCAKVLGSVGRLDWQKGYDLLLGMLPDISSKIPCGEKWGVVIVGEGAERIKLGKLALEAPENIKVVLPGFMKDAARSIGAFDLFVMPSRYEGFGLTLVEAMSQGVPIIASHVDSLPEVLASYPIGKLVDFESKEKDFVAAALVDMARHHKISFNNPFSLDQMVEGYLTVYRRRRAE